MHSIKHGENNLIMSFCIEHQDITKLHKRVEHKTIFSKRKTELFVFAKFFCFTIHSGVCGSMFTDVFRYVSLTPVFSKNYSSDRCPCIPQQSN